MKRIPAALLALPIMLIGVFAIGLVFGSVGEAISLVARGSDSSWPGWVRIVMAGLVGLVAGVGIARLLQLGLTIGNRAGRRFPRSFQALTDSVAVVLVLAFVVGVFFLILALFPRLPSQRIALVVSGLLLSAGSGFVLFSHFNKPRTPLTPPPSAGAAAREIERAAG